MFLLIDWLFILEKIGLISIILLVSLGVAAYATWGERKVAAIMQDRIGPARAGPFGLLQPLADGLKLFMKEEIIPNNSSKAIFVLGPAMFMVTALMTSAVIPWGPSFTIGDHTVALQVADVNISILFVFGVVSLGVYGIMLGGWSSNNKFSLLSSIRAASQAISYELAMGLSLIALLMMANTLSLNEIVQQQHGFWNDGYFTWNFFKQPLGFFIFLVCAFAELNRAPFDLPEAESELVGGFHTEYSGFGFAVMFLAEYANMLLLSLLAVFVFLGGWSTPLPNLFPIEKSGQSIFELIQKGQFATLTSGRIGEISGYLWGFFWTLSKAFILIFAQMWIRWTYPRLRPDQLMRLCWKYLTPLAIIAVLISAFWKYFETIFAY